MKKEITTKTGLISAYGYTCRYVQQCTSGSYSLRLYMEHKTYNIHYYNSQNQTGVWLREGDIKTARSEYKRLFNENIKPLINPIPNNF